MPGRMPAHQTALLLLRAQPGPRAEPPGCPAAGAAPRAGTWFGTPVAVKVVRTHVGEGHQLDLSREPMLSMAVSHPNVLTSYKCAPKTGLLLPPLLLAAAAAAPACRCRARLARLRARLCRAGRARAARGQRVSRAPCLGLASRPSASYPNLNLGLPACLLHLQDVRGQAADGWRGRARRRRQPGTSGAVIRQQRAQQRAQQPPRGVAHRQGLPGGGDATRGGAEPRVS